MGTTGEDRNLLAAHLKQLGLPRAGIQKAGTVPVEYGDPATVRRSGTDWFVVSLNGGWGRKGYPTATAAKKAAKAELRKKKAARANRGGKYGSTKKGAWVSTGTGGYLLRRANGGVYRINRKRTGPIKERWTLRYTGPRGGVKKFPGSKTATAAKAKATAHGKRA